MSSDRLSFDEIVRVQNLMASRIAQEDEVDLKIKVIDMISQLVGKKKYIQVEDLIVEAEYESISEQAILRVLDDLVSDKMIILADSRIIKNFWCSIFITLLSCVILHIILNYLYGFYEINYVTNII